MACLGQRGLLLHYSTRRGPMVASNKPPLPRTLAGAPARAGESRILGPIAVGAGAAVGAFPTFIVLAGLTRISPTHYVVVTLLLSNAATVLVLLGLIVREVWQVVRARRSGRAAARLHVRIVGLFSIIAAAAGDHGGDRCERHTRSRA